MLKESVFDLRVGWVWGELAEGETFQERQKFLVLNNIQFINIHPCLCLRQHDIIVI